MHERVAGLRVVNEPEDVELLLKHCVWLNENEIPRTWIRTQLNKRDKYRSAICTKMSHSLWCWKRGKGGMASEKVRVRSDRSPLSIFSFAMNSIFWNFLTSFKIDIWSYIFVWLVVLLSFVINIIAPDSEVLFTTLQRLEWKPGFFCTKEDERDRFFKISLGSHLHFLEERENKTEEWTWRFSSCLIVVTAALTSCQDVEIKSWLDIQRKSWRGREREGINSRKETFGASLITSKWWGELLSQVPGIIKTWIPPLISFLLLVTNEIPCVSTRYVRKIEKDENEMEGRITASELTTATSVKIVLSPQVTSATRRDTDGQEERSLKCRNDLLFKLHLLTRHWRDQLSLSCSYPFLELICNYFCWWWNKIGMFSE